MAIGWEFKTFTLTIDSLSVVNLIGNNIDACNHVKTKGSAEMLVKRHLKVSCGTITEFGLKVSVRFVSTTENKADCLTRVPKAWLTIVRFISWMQR